ncbi:reverse transcriptase domain-containing protein [Tanacetum coccineum]
MPVRCRMFQKTLDGPARGWFDRMPNGSINSWSDLRERFVERFSLRRRCSKDPTEVSKIVRKANESLSDFKERWTEEMGYIQGAPEVMQISAFMSNSKCPELARRFTDQVPQTVTEMMKRVDDFIKSEEAFKSTELPKGEQPEKGPGAPYKGFRPPRIIQGGGPPRGEGYNAHNRRDHYLPYVPPRQMGRRPKEILATELQLQLPPPSPLVGTPKKENMDKYCDYHGEKGHYTNDCFQLKRQLEIALESGKLNHLVKDVRQRGGNRGRQGGNGSTHGRIINMVYEVGKNRKRKCQGGGEEDWMSAPITFPSIPSDDVSDEPLIVEAEIEGYLVRRVFVDQGAAMQVMFEHCFRNLCPTIQARLSRTHTELVGFSGEQLQPIGKIKLEVLLGNEGLSRRTMMKFTVVEASSLYNIILGRTGIRELRAVSSTTHAMMKFLTPRGIATLVPRRDVIFEYIQIEVRQAFPGESPEEKPREKKKGRPDRRRYDQPNIPGSKNHHWDTILPSDYYPFPEIDLKIKDVMGFPFKCFLDAYKGYHQIQMSKEDEEKTAFYTDQGTFCYTKMPFGLKNARATYQRLVDSAFQTQMGRNLEAYVDDMVIKCRTEKDMAMDVMETFDNLRKINTKLNPKKCLFRVKEGKFLGYMVTSEGI